MQHSSQLMWKCAVKHDVALCAQDVVIRMKDSVVGFIKPDFLEKINDNEDL